MRASLLIVMAGLLGLTVSCAHKQATDSNSLAKKDIKLEKKLEVKKADNTVYTCLVGKDKRTVRLDKKDKRCEVQYTKYGDKQEVAWGQATPAICEKAFNSIRTNIEGSGYKGRINGCQKVEAQLKKKIEAKTTVKKDDRKTASAKLDTAPATPKK